MHVQELLLKDRPENFSSTLFNLHRKPLFIYIHADNGTKTQDSMDGKFCIIYSDLCTQHTNQLMHVKRE